MMKLGQEYIWKILVIIHFKNCYHLVYTPKHKIKIYEIILLPAVLYSCGTWSHTLRENINYMYLKTLCPGKYFDLRRN